MSDFSKNQGGIESSTSTEFPAHESDAPKSGISEAPASERPQGGAGPGIGNTRKGIR